jgi:hypothetical protein
MERRASNPSRELLTQRSAAARARTTNRDIYLPGVDGRSTVARRYHDITIAVISDQGGLDNMSELRLHLCKRAAAVNTMIEQLEARLVAGEPIDQDKYVSLIQASIRLSNTLGLNRRTKKVLSPRDYLASQTNGYAEDEDEDEASTPRRVIRSRVIEHDDGEDDDD